MNNERVSGECQHFVKKQKGHQVSCQCYSNGYCDAEAEIAEKMASIGGLFQVADGIYRGQQPQNTGEGGKQGGKRIGIEQQHHPGNYSQADCIDLTIINADIHDQD